MILSLMWWNFRNMHLARIFMQNDIPPLAFFSKDTAYVNYPPTDEWSDRGQVIVGGEVLCTFYTRIRNGSIVMICVDGEPRNAL